MIKQRVNRVYHVGILYFYMYIKDKESDKMIIHWKIYVKHYENFRFYDLRGSYATTILRNGVEIRDVADVLGHKDIETTENYYISSTDETRKNVTDSYENAINLDVIEEIIEYKISI